MILIDEALAEIDARAARPVYLITGEEYLVRRASDEIVGRLVPKAVAALNVSILEGASPAEVTSELLTLPMFRGNKVVVVREPEFLAPKTGRKHALSAVREAWQEGRRDAAVRRALALAARAGWGPDKLDPTAAGSPSAEEWKRELDVELAEADVAFLKEVAAYAREQGLVASGAETSGLEEAIEKGLPAGHHLVIEATLLDRRSSLAKKCEKAGALLSREVEADVRKLSLADVVREVLEPLHKQLSPRGEQKLKDLCGGSMRLVHNELEKLAAYVGDRATIDEADVEELVLRTREGEFFALSDALFRRDAAAAIEYLERALAQGDVPLRLLASIASAVRRLLEERERLDHRRGEPPRMSYREFASKEFPRLAEEMTARGKKAPHPFAAYNAMQAALGFSIQDLVRAHAFVAEADLLLKTSAQPRLVLESLAWRICGTRG